MRLTRPLVLSVLIATVGALPMFLLGALAVMLGPDLRLNPAQIGGAATMFNIVGAASSVPAARLGERLSLAGLAILAGLFAMVSLVGMALTPAFYPAILLFMGVGGLGNSVSQTCANLMLAGGAAGSTQGFAFGIKQSAAPLAMMLSGMSVPLLGTTVGWRWAFGLFALVSVVPVVMLVFTTRATPGGGRPKKPTGPVLNESAFLLFAIASGLASTVTSALVAFFVIWAVQVGIPQGLGGTLLAVASSLAIVARVLVGIWADKRGRRHIPWVSGHIAVGAIGILLISTGVPALLVVGAVLSYAIGWSWPGLLMMALVRLSPQAPARSTSMVQMGAFTGGVVGPALFGVIIQFWGFPIAWRIGAVMLAAGSALLLLARAKMVRRFGGLPPG